MMQSIVINERSAATVRNILDTIEAGRKASEHLPTYVEALGAALDVPPGWRFDVQTMAFMPPAEQAEIPGLSGEFVAEHQNVFCGATPGPEQESLLGETQTEEA